MNQEDKAWIFIDELMENAKSVVLGDRRMEYFMPKLVYWNEPMGKLTLFMEDLPQDEDGVIDRLKELVGNKHLVGMALIYLGDLASVDADIVDVDLTSPDISPEESIVVEARIANKTYSMFAIIRRDENGIITSIDNQERLSTDTFFDRLFQTFH